MLATLQNCVECYIELVIFLFQCILFCSRAFIDDNGEPKVVNEVNSVRQCLFQKLEVQCNVDCGYGSFV